MSESFIPYARPSLEDDDVAAVVEVLRGQWLTQGPHVAEFETAVAAHAGARFAVAVATGTAALHAAYFAAGIAPGDEILTTPITFAATGNAALFLGAGVRFADIRADTYNLDAARLEAAIGPRTKAIVPVDFTGQPCDMDEINAVARRHGLAVISDSAHSLGATYKGRRVGTLAALTALSFHAVKHLALGEGGMVLTDDEALARRMRLFRSHGITNEPAAMLLPGQASDADNPWARGPAPAETAAWYYEMQEIGFNYRLTDIQCALGLSQLRKLDRNLARRLAIVRRYDQAFADNPYLIVPYQSPDRVSAWHLYMLRLRLERMAKSRRQVFDALRGLGIGVHVHYIPLHLQPVYRERFGYRRGDFPIAEAYYDSALTVPLFPAMTDDEIGRVIDGIRQVVR